MRKYRRLSVEMRALASQYLETGCERVQDALHLSSFDQFAPHAMAVCSYLRSLVARLCQRQATWATRFHSSRARPHN